MCKNSLWYKHKFFFFQLAKKAKQFMVYGVIHATAALLFCCLSLIHCYACSIVLHELGERNWTLLASLQVIIVWAKSHALFLLTLTVHNFIPGFSWAMYLTRVHYSDQSCDLTKSRNDVIITVPNFLQIKF